MYKASSFIPLVVSYFPVQICVRRVNCLLFTVSTSRTPDDDLEDPGRIEVFLSTDPGFETIERKGAKIQHPSRWQSGRPTIP